MLWPLLTRPRLQDGDHLGPFRLVRVELESVAHVKDLGERENRLSTPHLEWHIQAVFKFLLSFEDHNALLPEQKQ